MKRVLLVIGILTQLVMSQVAYAYTATFTDNNNFWPTWLSSDATDNGKDVIGHPDISGGTANYYANRSIDTITFNNVGASWSDLYSTELFINVITSANDTTWDYVVRGLNYSAGDYALWNITNAGLSSVKGVNPLSDFVITSPTTLSIRNDHPIALDPSIYNNALYFGNPLNISNVGTVHFDGLANGFNTAYEFTDGLVQVGEMGYILGWGVNCANDMIYEQIPAPEPGTMVLLGFGMLGLAIYGKRRMQM